MSDAAPPFAAALGAWARIALLSFGGPAAQIAVMHRVLVEEKGWVDERRFLNALNFCMLLPGPEAMQLATYLGWMTHGVRGGLVAGTLFVLPGFISILALSYVYVLLGDTPAVAAMLFGLKAAVLAVVLVALNQLRRRVLRDRARLVLALAAFVAMFFFQLPFPLVILAAAGFGLWQARHLRAPAGPVPGPAQGARTLVTAAIGLAAWLVPLGALALWLGPAHVLSQVGLFFSQVAVVSFGGAYAVLAYVAQHAVETQGWLSPVEMVDGLGLAETTPGPLIQVLQFVAFLAAWRDAAPFGPVLAGLFASIVATWATFVPCFLWVFTGAPWVERLLHQPRVSGAMAGIGAAVVGAVLNLSVWFALHVLFQRLDTLQAGPVRLLLPDPASLDIRALVFALAALVLLAWRGWGLLTVLGLAVAAGVILEVSAA
ncbi:chromate efflux transporter [Thioalkalivibrio sp. XN279]|uniref:chromate efflux transporter n=1 Tax=Thioalkalivibrio sp. XN279 TaxID=2714953 RepID=UPI00140DD7E2|nr:chromate efflux transporter [Thioalkalivibrio sp. XN279]NHA14342.1 chromate efflux transporter [Thioalkalivibrio sp. XN279]